MKKSNILKRTKKKRNINLIFDILLFVYLILNILNYIFAFKGKLQLATILTMSGIGLLMFVVILFKRRNWQIPLFVALMFLFGGISTIFTGNTSVLVYLTMFRYIGVAVYLVYYRQNKKIMNAMMIITLILLSPVFFQKLGFNLLSKASRNSYSILLFIANLIFNKAYWDRKEKAPMFPTIASLFICIFSGGRSGIITYSIFIVGTLINNYRIMKNTLFKEKGVNQPDIVVSLENTREIPIITDEMLIEEGKHKKHRTFFKVIKTYKMDVLKLIAIVCIFLLLFGFKYLDKEYNIFSLIELQLEDNVTDPAYGFAEKGLSSRARVRLIKRYFEYAFTDVNAFLNGVKLEQDSLFESFSYNLHNSYLLLHSKFGIYGVILCGYLCFRALINMIRTKRWGDMLIYIAILARIFMDNAAFPRHLDIVIFYFVFTYYSLPNKEKKKKRNFRFNTLKNKITKKNNKEIEK